MNECSWHHSLYLCTNLIMLSSIQGIFCQALLAFHKTMVPLSTSRGLENQAFMDQCSGFSRCASCPGQRLLLSGPARLLCLFVLAVSSIPWLPMAILWLGCIPFFFSLVSPKYSFRAQLKFAQAPSSLSPAHRIGSFQSTLITLNNANHKFWNSSKKRQTLSDVCVWSSPKS